MIDTNKLKRLRMRTNNLKPNTNYELNAEDINFSVQLAKVGSVHLLSSQVLLTATGNKGLKFHECSSLGVICDGLQLPSAWSIENIITNTDGKVEVLFIVNRRQ